MGKNKNKKLIARKKIIKWGSWLFKLVFLSSIMGNIILLSPSISLSPMDKNDKIFPLESLFNLTNNSNYSIYEIECRIVKKEINTVFPMDRKSPIVMYSKASGGRILSDSVKEIKKLAKGKTVSIDVAKLMGLLMVKPSEASMTIEISYKIFVWPVRLKVEFPFELKKMKDGKYQIAAMG